MKKIIFLAVLSSFAFSKTIINEPIISENPCKEYDEEPRFASIDEAIQWYDKKTNCELDKFHLANFDKKLDKAKDSIPTFINWLKENKEEILKQEQGGVQDNEKINPYEIEIFNATFDSLVLPKEFVENGLYGYEAGVSSKIINNINQLRWILDEYGYDEIPSAVLDNYDGFDHDGLLIEKRTIKILSDLKNIELIDRILFFNFVLNKVSKKVLKKSLRFLLLEVIAAAGIVVPEGGTTISGFYLATAEAAFFIESIYYISKEAPDKMEEILKEGLENYRNNINHGYWFSTEQNAFWVPGVDQRYPHLSAVNFNKFIRDVNFYNHNRTPLKTLTVPQLEKNTVRNENWFKDDIMQYTDLKKINKKNMDEFENAIEHLDDVNLHDVILYYFQGNGPLWDFSFVLTEDAILVDRQVRPKISKVSYRMDELIEKEIKIIDYEGQKSLKVKGTNLKVKGDLEMITFLRNTILETMKNRRAEN